MSPAAKTLATAANVIMLSPCLLVGLVTGAFLTGPVASAGQPRVAANGWAAPLPAGAYRYSSGYGPRWGGFHHGQDLAASTGTRSSPSPPAS